MKLSEFFKDGQGNYSSMRLGFLGLSFNVGFVWTYLCFKNNAFYDIPGGIAALIGGLAVGKAVQTFGEK